MTAYKDRSKEELLKEKSTLEAQYRDFQGKGLKLDMSRPSLGFSTTILLG